MIIKVRTSDDRYDYILSKFFCDFYCQTTLCEDKEIFADEKLMQAELTENRKFARLLRVDYTNLSSEDREFICKRVNKCIDRFVRKTLGADKTEKLLNSIETSVQKTFTDRDEMHTGYYWFSHSDMWVVQ